MIVERLSEASASTLTPLQPLVANPSDHDGQEQVDQVSGILKAFSPRPHKAAPSLKALKDVAAFRHSSFFETSTVNKQQDEQGQKRLNQYILYQVIGQGAFGKVRKAYWPEKDRFYAVKIINKKHVRKLSRASRKPGGDGLDTVRKEFAIWKLLEHPNIVRLKEVIDAPQSEKMYMVSELIDGGAIVDGESTCTPLLESQAKNFFCQLIEGIDFLHFHKVIHRDIKPSNLLSGPDGVLKITDFGLSHVFEDKDEDYRQTVGTGPFLAPEMLTGGKFKGIPVDIWACGVTLFMLVFGCLPFQGDSLSELYDKIKNQPLEFPPSPDGSPINQDLIALLTGILDKNPDTRLTTTQIRAHPWTQQGFERVQSVAELKPIAITQESVEAAISPVHLYEKLQKKIKAIALVKKLGEGSHSQSGRNWNDQTLPNIVNPERIQTVADAKAHLLQEAPIIPKRPSFTQSPSPRVSSHKAIAGEMTRSPSKNIAPIGDLNEVNNQVLNPSASTSKMNLLNPTASSTLPEP